MLSTIDQIYEAVTDDAALARLPAVLAEATGARSAIIIRFDERLRPLDFSRHGIADEMQARFTELDMAQHDVWTRLPMRDGRLNEAVLCEDYIDADSFRRTTFYNELYRPFDDDTARCMGVIMSGAGGFTSVGLHRAYRQRPFEREARAGLQALLPHLRRLREIRARLAVAETGTALVSAALDELPCGLMVAGADGRLLHANARAEAILQARDGVRLDRGRVVAVAARDQDRFAEAIRSAACAADARGGAMRLPRAGGQALRVLVAPLAGASGGALVLLDPPEDADGSAETLKGLYGLTPGEAELARLLASGLSPSEAAERRGVRLSTVRSQIVALLHKTETAGLGDLLRILGRTPRLARRGDG